MSNFIKIVPAELHLEIVQGDDFRLSIDFDFNLTGYAITAAIIPKTGANVPLVIANKVEASGTFDVTLDKVATELLAAAHHSWFLIMTPSGGATRTYFQGRFIVRKR